MRTRDEILKYIDGLDTENSDVDIEIEKCLLWVLEDSPANVADDVKSVLNDFIDHVDDYHKEDTQEKQSDRDRWKAEVRKLIKNYDKMMSSNVLNCIVRNEYQHGTWEKFKQQIEKIRDGIR